MACPTTKPDLLDAASDRFEKLFSLIASMTDSQRTATFDLGSLPGRTEAHWGRDRNLRDVLVHLHEWHRLLLGWVEANQRGEARPFLPEPYTWKTYGQMNVALWREHRSTALEEAEVLLRSSHEEVVALIARFTDEELLEKKRFPWTGTTSLGSYCVSVTSSHYEWAITKIRTYLRTVGRRA